MPIYFSPLMMHYTKQKKNANKDDIILVTGSNFIIAEII